MIYKLLTIFIIAVFIPLWSLFGFVGYWIFETPKTLAVVLEQELVDRNGTPKLFYKPGETLFVKRWMRSHVVEPAIKVARAVIYDTNGEVVYRDTLIPIASPLGDSIRVIRVTLPLDLRPGQYTLRTYITYTMNTIRDGTYELEPTHFEVALG